MKISLELQIAAADYVLGNIPSDELPEIALSAMKQGYESPSLIILAGMSKADDYDDLKRYFLKALKELNSELPDHRTAVLTILEGNMQLITESKIDPLSGMQNIVHGGLRNIQKDEFKDDKKYLYDGISIHISKLYGLYDTYDETPHHTKNLDKFKSKIKDEAKAYLDEVNR